MAGHAKYVLLRTLRRLGLLSRVDLELSFVHRGRRLRVPVAGGVGIEHWQFADPQMLPVISSCVRLSEGAFIDVGAHIGETLLKLLLVDDGRPYVGVEPQLAAAAYLERLLKANSRPGHVLSAALGDRNDIAELQLTAMPLDDSASIVTGIRDERRVRERRWVPLVCGDTALAAIGINRVGVLKVDVEGAEIEVLNGLAETIARDRPLILCEILPIYDESTPIGRFRRVRSDAIVDFATERRYRLLRVREGVPEPIRRIETHADFALREHVLVPQEQEGRFRALATSHVDPAVRA